ncbi:Fork head protein -like protein 2 [Ceratocystis fimbriata CBS 114723]|uniref:Fork head protein-like protein 2 n=1 Tax=Ceratocystis fimbriata CBS 114723 TaxID=1035309 RepID=A0A2C5WKK6_9PEZI|nr:Fork head protein -like protein 2 [Ceratocystis fimbriata CBS 114723]
MTSTQMQMTVAGPAPVAMSQVAVSDSVHHNIMHHHNRSLSGQQSTSHAGHHDSNFDDDEQVPMDIDSDSSDEPEPRPRPAPSPLDPPTAPALSAPQPEDTEMKFPSQTPLRASTPTAKSIDDNKSLAPIQASEDAPHTPKQLEPTAKIQGPSISSLTQPELAKADTSDKDLIDTPSKSGEDEITTAPLPSTPSPTPGSVSASAPDPAPAAVPIDVTSPKPTVNSDAAVLDVAASATPMQTDDSSLLAPAADSNSLEMLALSIPRTPAAFAHHAAASMNGIMNPGMNISSLNTNRSIFQALLSASSSSHSHVHSHMRTHPRGTLNPSATVVPSEVNFSTQDLDMASSSNAISHSQSPPLRNPRRTMDRSGLESFARIEFADSTFQMTTYSIIIGRDQRALRQARKDETRALERQRLKDDYSLQGLDPPSEIMEDRKFSKSYVSEEGGMLGPESDGESTDRPTKRRRLVGSGGGGTASGTANGSPVPENSSTENIISDRQYVSHTPGAAAVDLASLRPSPDHVPFLGIHSPGPNIAMKTKAISREHMKIQFNKKDHVFEAIPLHKNGFFCEEVLYRDEKVVLRSYDMLQIKDVSFTFIINGVEQGCTGAEDVEDEQTLKRRYSEGGKEMSLDFEASMANADDSSDQLSDLSDVPLDLMDSDSDDKPQPKSVKLAGKTTARKSPSLDSKDLATREEAHNQSFADSPPDPSQQPLKRRGPGRPPKDGIMSKRQHRERKKMLQEQERQKRAEEAEAEAKVQAEIQAAKEVKAKPQTEAKTEDKEKPQLKAEVQRPATAKLTAKPEVQHILPEPDDSHIQLQALVEAEPTISVKVPSTPKPTAKPASKPATTPAPVHTPIMLPIPPPQPPKPTSPPKQPHSFTIPLPNLPEKRKYKKRKSRDEGFFEGSDAERRAREKKEKRSRPKSPPLELKIEDYTPEQLQKPNKNYSVLIDETLTAAGPDGLTLKQIYKRISLNYPWFYFHTETKGWESSVRHNLIGNEAFRKDEVSNTWSRVPGVELDAGKKRKATSPDQGTFPIYQQQHSYQMQYQAGTQQGFQQATPAQTFATSQPQQITRHTQIYNQATPALVAAQGQAAVAAVGIAPQTQGQAGVPGRVPASTGSVTQPQTSYTSTPSRPGLGHTGAATAPLASTASVPAIAPAPHRLPQAAAAAQSSAQSRSQQAASPAAGAVPGTPASQSSVSQPRYVLHPRLLEAIAVLKHGLGQNLADAHVQNATDIVNAAVTRFLGITPTETAVINGPMEQICMRGFLGVVNGAIGTIEAGVKTTFPSLPSTATTPNNMALAQTFGLAGRTIIEPHAYLAMENFRQSLPRYLSSLVEANRMDALGISVMIRVLGLSRTTLLKSREGVDPATAAVQAQSDEQLEGGLVNSLRRVLESMGFVVPTPHATGNTPAATPAAAVGPSPMRTPASQPAATAVPTHTTPVQVPPSTQTQTHVSAPAPTPAPVAAPATTTVPLPAPAATVSVPASQAVHHSVTAVPATQPAVHTPTPVQHVVGVPATVSAPAPHIATSQASTGQAIPMQVSSVPAPAPAPTHTPIPAATLVPTPAPAPAQQAQEQQLPASVPAVAATSVASVVPASTTPVAQAPALQTPMTAAPAAPSAPVVTPQSQPPFEAPAQPHPQTGVGSIAQPQIQSQPQPHPQPQAQAQAQAQAPVQPQLSLQSQLTPTAHSVSTNPAVPLAPTPAPASTEPPTQTPSPAPAVQTQQQTLIPSLSATSTLASAQTAVAPTPTVLPVSVPAVQAQVVPTLSLPAAAALTIAPIMSSTPMTAPTAAPVATPTLPIATPPTVTAFATDGSVASVNPSSSHLPVLATSGASLPPVISSPAIAPAPSPAPASVSTPATASVAAQPSTPAILTAASTPPTAAVSAPSLAPTHHAQAAGMLAPAPASAPTAITASTTSAPSPGPAPST